MDTWYSMEMVAYYRVRTDRLNGEGHVTRTGKPWNGVQVGRVLERAGA